MPWSSTSVQSVRPSPPHVLKAVTGSLPLPPPGPLTCRRLQLVQLPTFLAVCQACSGSGTSSQRMLHNGSCGVFSTASLTSWTPLAAADGGIRHYSVATALDRRYGQHYLSIVESRRDVCAGTSLTSCKRCSTSSQLGSHHAKLEMSKSSPLSLSAPRVSSLAPG